MEKIKFTPVGEAEEVEFFIIEQAKLGGVTYLLVTESDDETEDADAYILKDLSAENEAEGLYEFVEDDDVLESVSELFEKLLDGVDIEVEQ